MTKSTDNIMHYVGKKTQPNDRDINMITARWFIMMNELANFAWNWGQTSLLHFHWTAYWTNFEFSLTPPSGPGQSSSRDVRPYVVCMSPPREIYFEASHWPWDHMISSRPLIGQPHALPPYPAPFLVVVLISANAKICSVSNAQNLFSIRKSQLFLYLNAHSSNYFCGGCRSFLYALY